MPSAPSVLTSGKKFAVYAIHVVVILISLIVVGLSFTQLSSQETTSSNLSLWDKQMNHTATCKDTDSDWVEYRPIKLKYTFDSQYLICPWREEFSALRIVAHSLSVLVAIFTIVFVLVKRHQLAFWILLALSLFNLVLLGYSAYRDVTYVYKSREFCENNKGTWQNDNKMNPKKEEITCAYDLYILTAIVNMFSILWVPAVVLTFLYTKVWKKYNILPASLGGRNSFDTL